MPSFITKDYWFSQLPFSPARAPLMSNIFPQYNEFLKLPYGVYPELLERCLGTSSSGWWLCKRLTVQKSFMGPFLLPHFSRGNATITDELCGWKEGRWNVSWWLLLSLLLQSSPSPSARREPPRQANVAASMGKAGGFCCPASALPCFMFLLQVHSHQTATHVEVWIWGPLGAAKFPTLSVTEVSRLTLCCENSAFDTLTISQLLNGVEWSQRGCAEQVQQSPHTASAGGHWSMGTCVCVHVCVHSLAKAGSTPLHQHYLWASLKKTQTWASNIPVLLCFSQWYQASGRESMCCKVPKRCWWHLKQIQNVGIVSKKNEKKPNPKYTNRASPIHRAFWNTCNETVFIRSVTLSKPVSFADTQDSWQDVWARTACLH